MKQVIALHYPSFGGPHNLVLRLWGPFSTRGWETTLILPTEPGDAVDRFNNAGIHPVQVPLHRLRASLDVRRHLTLAATFPAEVARLRQILREERPDVAVVSGLVNPHLAVAAAGERIPVVWQMVDDVVPSPVRRLMMSFVKRVATVLMFDGEALSRLYLGDRAVRRPVFIYYPPVDCATFMPSANRRRSTRSKLGIPQEAVIVGTVANLIPLKGIVDFVQAASLVFRSVPHAWFLVVGAPLPTHPGYLKTLRDEVAQSEVPTERFIFTGGRADVENYYPAMDLKVIASHTESTTTTAMEAMACGIPVVATDVGGVREVVNAGSTGLLVPPRDHSALAAACLQILGDPIRAAKMGQRAREIAEERFDMSKCLEVHLNAYDAAIRDVRRPKQRFTSSGK